MAVKVYLGYAQAAHGEMTYEEADAFHVTAGGFLLIQISTRENRRIWRCSRPAGGSTRKSCGSRRQVRGELPGVQHVRRNARTHACRQPRSSGR